MEVRYTATPNTPISTTDQKAPTIANVYGKARIPLPIMVFVTWIVVAVRMVAVEAQDRIG